MVLVLVLDRWYVVGRRRRGHRGRPGSRVMDFDLLGSAISADLGNHRHQARNFNASATVTLDPHPLHKYQLEERSRQWFLTHWTLTRHALIVELHSHTNLRGQAT